MALTVATALFSNPPPTAAKTPVAVFCFPALTAAPCPAYQDIADEFILCQNGRPWCRRARGSRTTAGTSLLPQLAQNTLELSEQQGTEKQIRPDAMFEMPPLTVDALPDASLSAPPTTMHESPEAMLIPPPPTADPGLLAQFPAPPTTAEPTPSATLPLPPLTTVYVPTACVATSQPAT